MSALAAVALAACSSSSNNDVTLTSVNGVVSTNGVSAHPVALTVGQEIDVTLGTIGPGEWQTPALSSPSLRFLDVTDVPPYNPGGPVQRFRFTATVPGRTIITFTHFENRPIAQDTIDVR